MADFFQKRSVFIQIIVISIAILLVIQLFLIQILGVGGYKFAAENQAVKRKIIYPARGVIYDRKGEIILNNSIFYDLKVEPNKIKKDFDTAFFCKLINVSKPDFEKKLAKVALRNGAWKSSVLYKSLSSVTVARLQETINEFPAFELIENAERTYPFSCAAIVLGYINEISPRMLEKEKYASYQSGDYVGITGIESTYESVLRGKPGVNFLLQDVKQRVVGKYKNGDLDSPSVVGKSLELYMDVKLQQLTEHMMANKLGSAIAIDPKTGGILAFVSSPTFKPELLSGAERGNNFAKLLNDATKPLFNRAIMANYSPGSTFKPITALVALDEKVITPSYGFPCGGGYYKCGRRIGCTHSGGGHAANLKLAIAHSCNSYFCHILRLAVDAPKHKNVHIGLQRWNEYMTSFGLGHPIGIDIPSEMGGNIPDSTYFNKTYKNNWNSCNFSIMGMGQGEVLMTPLQMANAMCIIANKGSYYIPHFVKSIGKNTKHPMLEKYNKKHIVAHIPDSAFAAVIDGMEGVVNFGTGKIAKIPNIAVCGKTGTVENYRIINGKKMKLKNHSMFVAFAPKDNPTIAVAVCVENSGYGATWAGPIASLMIEQFLTDTISPKRKYLVQRMASAKIIPQITYLLDSLQKQKDRQRELLRKQKADSLKRIENYKDSIKKLNTKNKSMFFIKPEETY